MKLKMLSRASTLGLISLLLVTGSAWGQEQADANAPPTSTKSEPLKYGSYFAGMGFFTHSDDKDADLGGEADLGVGYRKDFYAVEVAGIYGKLKNTKYQRGAVINGLLFPFKAPGLDGLFVSLGLGTLNYTNHLDQDPTQFHTLTTALGGGYLLPLNIGRYEFGLRAEAKYRYGKRDRHLDSFGEDYPNPRYYNDELIGIGLQLPLSMPPPPAPPPAPPAVVKMAPACSDGIDNDGDGKIDYPADPGCTSPDDDDETDPPPPVVANPCKVPLPGERVSLAGCSTGDVLVLRGVNFEFDKSKLTPNAKAILDNVGDELKKYPGISVEIGGHTDSKGTDKYNQRLSEARARSVKKYLVSIGITDVRMTTAGYGATQPIADNATDEGREQNRRVELKIMGSDSGGLTESVPATPADGSDAGMVETMPAAATPAPAEPAAQ